MPSAPFRRQSAKRPAGAAARLRAVATLGGLLLLALAARGAEPDANHEPLGQLLAGLLTYTNWPTPLANVRLCTWGHGHGVDELQHHAQLGSTQRTVTVAQGGTVADAAAQCDAVYVAASAPARALDLPRALLGRPVLVIGEGAGFCAAGGMFCVEFDGPALRFHANLDAIARSGLRVHPQVLRIARNNPSSGS
jgi:hypothetical protein